MSSSRVPTVGKTEDDLVVRHCKTRMFELHRRNHIGLALIDAIDEMLVEDADRGFTPELAYKIVQQFDHAMAKAVAKAKTSASPVMLR